MAMMMKKEDFLKLVGGMKSPRLVRNHIYVSVYDEAQEEKEGVKLITDVYCASSYREESYISASNQMSKYRGWMEAAK